MGIIFGTISSVILTIVALLLFVDFTYAVANFMYGGNLFLGLVTVIAMIISLPFLFANFIRWLDGLYR